jgi:hypothetical protein
VLSGPQPSLEDSTRLDPAFTALDFETVTFLLWREQGRQPCVQRPTWRIMYNIATKNYFPYISLRFPKFHVFIYFKT